MPQRVYAQGQLANGATPQRIDPVRFSQSDHNGGDKGTHACWRSLQAATTRLEAGP